MWQLRCLLTRVPSWIYGTTARHERQDKRLPSARGHPFVPIRSRRIGRAAAAEGRRGAQVSKLVASERQKLLDLSDVLHRRVIGQEEAVDAVADAIQRCAP